MGDASRELVERASRGDAGAVDALLALHLPELRRFVAGRLGRALERRESASDLVMSACREVLENVDRFRYDGEDGFRRWLYVTALRKIRDRHRYWQAERRRAERESPDRARRNATTGRDEERARLTACFRSLATPSQEAIAREELERIERAFAELPAKYRDVIMMHHVDGLSHLEIGRRLGVREAYARLLLSRGLARIGRLLNGR